MNEIISTSTNVTETILTDDHFFTALLADIRAAKQSILLETYIYANDKIGREVSTALCDAARRKVTVSVLIDGFGSMWWGGELAEQLEKAGVKIRIYHPLPWYLSHWKYASRLPRRYKGKFFHLITHINARNHRKLCIIDNDIVYIGSANISDVHLSKNKNGQNWRDTTVRLLHVNPQTLINSFNRAWGRISVKSVLRNTLRKSPVDLVFRLNDTVRQRRAYYKKLSKEISSAKERIWITNAYFNPNNKILNLLANAARRGVDVRMILPYQSDIFATSLLSRTYYSALLKDGVAIFEYLPRVLHAKILIIDDCFYVGSSNLNYRSLHHDLELDARIFTANAQSILAQQFINDIFDSKQITIDDVNTVSIIKRFAGWILLYLRYWF